MNVFNTLTLKQILWKTQTLLKGGGIPFFSSKHLDWKRNISIQNGSELWVQNGRITKNGVLPVTTLYFRKFYFNLRTSYQKLIWCTNNLDVHIHTFRKRCSVICGAFSQWMSLTTRQLHFNPKTTRLFEDNNILNCIAFVIVFCFAVD